MKKAIEIAMKHRDVLGSGAKKRKNLPPKERGEAVEQEFHRGTLRSGGSGKHVTNPLQMVAIKYSEMKKR
jgi:hypothetical protein